MLKFNETPDGYIFSLDNKHLAVGVYEQGVFHLLHDDQLVTYSNAMQAFSHLRSIYEPSVASPKTMELFLTPSRPIDNMSKYRDNVILKDMPSEVFHAHLPS
jgi:hypothetical protein